MKKPAAIAAAAETHSRQKQSFCQEAAAMVQI
jgi:hypothetical protein